MNHTTQTLPRTARQSGTERAASIEGKRRSNRASIQIILGCVALVCLGYGIGWWAA